MTSAMVMLSARRLALPRPKLAEQYDINNAGYNLQEGILR